MTTATWYIAIGGVLLFMAISAARIKRLPLSTAILYLTFGLVLGPTVTNQFHFNPLEHSVLLEVVTEIAVLISLFGAGLKLAAPVGHAAWWLPFRLATISMVLTVGMIACAGVFFLDIPLGAAVLLGAVLAPTDPVLATDIQVRKPGDQDQLRFTLTAEAGLNDGSAFPMVMLGLGLLGLHDLGDNYSRWLLVDVIWASFSGLGIGGVLGVAAAQIIHRLHKHGIQSDFMNDFLGLGLIAMAYGLSLLVLGYGFLAVFAAGFMLHRTEVRLDSRTTPNNESSESTSQTATGHMATVSLAFVEQLERVGEVTLLLLLGGMLFVDSWQWQYVAVGLTLLFIVRPLSVGIALIGNASPRRTKLAISWFGVRGIGSFYYLMYAIQHGLDEPIAVTLVSTVLVVVTMSIVLHGVTVTPLMKKYAQHFP